jgi:hypothetical protein
MIAVTSENEEAKGEDTTADTIDIDQVSSLLYVQNLKYITFPIYSMILVTMMITLSQRKKR